LLDGKLGKYRLYEGDTLIIGAYAVHKNAKYWEDPDTFNPGKTSS
jgi:cytochrome P450